MQHALLALLTSVGKGKISIEKLVQKACHNPAILFQVESRGYIKEGFQADLVLVDLEKKTTVTKDNLLYQCGWSPFEGTTFDASIEKTWVNGQLVYDQGEIIEAGAGEQLTFSR